VVRLEERLFRVAGVNVDLELALFDADHGAHRRALTEARAEWGRRHSVLVADALGWALLQNGRPVQALRFARRATRLGYRDALLYFHKGMIETALHDRVAARRDLRYALAINPHFSILYSPVARRTVASLMGVAR